MSNTEELISKYEDVQANLHFISYIIENIKDTDSRFTIRRIGELANEILILLEKCQSSSYDIPPFIISSISNCRQILIGEPTSNQLVEVKRLLMRCRGALVDRIKEFEAASFNSPEYYKREIASFNERIQILTKELERRDQLHNEEISSKELEKRELYDQIAQYRRNEEMAKKRDDAKAIWKTAIEESFKILDSGIQPIKDEKKRLKYLYIAYCMLSLVMLTILVITEVLAVVKLSNYIGIPPFRVYLSLLVPIPIALSLLIVFMTQINRAQRQMVTISKYIQDIKYIEGILLAMNNLSVDIEDSMRRINDALDKLLERHLMSEKESLYEDNLKLLEKKDAIPLNRVYELLSIVLGHADKND